MKKFLSILLFGVLLVLLSPASHATADPVKPGKELKAPIYKAGTDVSTIKVDWTKKLTVKKKFRAMAASAPYCSTNGVVVAWWAMGMAEATGMNYVLTVFTSYTPCAECGTVYCAQIYYWAPDPVPF